jgi:hypothetical protein
MKRSFTLDRSRVVGADGTTLTNEVTHYTDSDEETATILRGIERLGMDASIRHYEITPKIVQRVYGGASPVVWSVRAVRDQPDEQ